MTPEWGKMSPKEKQEAAGKALDRARRWLSGRNEATDNTERELEIGRSFYAKLKTTQVLPVEANRLGVKSLRGVDPVETWLINTGGEFPEGPIYYPAPKNTRFVSNTTYEFVDQNTGETKLGINFESNTQDGVRRPFFFEVNKKGEIDGLVLIKKTDKDRTLEPIEVNYKALPAFIKNKIKVGIN